jgi:CDP-diacylglycerol--glycerol-3-phosphate 3-phosphatidyltransferase|tara:strand:- start:199 stop:801 length:603 start_codon:yes stop_codon:yes gene_type:complete
MLINNLHNKYQVVTEILNSMNWANVATYTRVLLIPLIIMVYLSEIKMANILAAVVFLVASVTDWLDGYLARRLNQGSNYGAFIDPVADKLLVVSVVTLMLSVYPLMLVPCLIIVTREIVVSALREWMAQRKSRSLVAVGFIGKLKTTVQMIALTVLLLVGPNSPAIFLQFGMVLLWSAALLSLISMGVYFKDAWHTLNDD